MTNAPAPFVTTERARKLGDALLDRRYVVAFSPIAAMLETSSSRALVNRRLSELATEVERLVTDDKAVDTDNAVLRAFEADATSWLKRVTTLMDVNAPAMQRTGIDAAFEITRELSLPGLSQQQISAIGWTDPDGDQIEQSIDFISRPEWNDKLTSVESANGSVISAVIARNITSDPQGMVRELQEVIDNYPRFLADNTMRTLQLNTERRAVAAIGVANANLIVKQIRVSALKSTTCLSCVALHGTELALGEYVIDHDGGLCQAVLIVQGRPYQVRTGQEYFDDLTDQQRASYMGYANYQAYQAGEVTLQDFVHRYTDPLYGEQLRQASLKGILGDQAQQFYKNKGTN